MLAQVEAHTEIEKHRSPIDQFEISLGTLHQTFHVFPNGDPSRVQRSESSDSVTLTSALCSRTAAQYTAEATRN